MAVRRFGDLSNDLKTVEISDSDHPFDRRVTRCARQPLRVYRAAQAD